MQSRIKLFGHALHPILIVFPLGLLATAVIFDVVYLVADDSAMTIVAYWMIVAGVSGGFAAAWFGWILDPGPACLTPDRTLVVFPF